MAASVQGQLFMRLQDRVDSPPQEGRLNFERLLGNWQPTDPEPQVLQAVSIASSGGTLTAECFGSGLIVPPEGCSARITTTFAAGPASQHQMAFFADVESDVMKSRYQGNVNLGLLVLAGFHDFKDGSDHSNFFSREFYYFSGAGINQPPAQNASSKTGSRRLGTSDLVGSWQNTNSSSMGVPRIEIKESGAPMVVRAFGAGESGMVDWGEVPARVYGKDFHSHEAIAFSATFIADPSGASEGMRCHLQANIKQGVLVVAYFTEFNDGSGRSNYFAREFYYKI